MMRWLRKRESKFPVNPVLTEPLGQFETMNYRRAAEVVKKEIAEKLAAERIFAGFSEADVIIAHMETDKGKFEIPGFVSRVSPDGKLTVSFGWSPPEDITVLGTTVSDETGNFAVNDVSMPHEIKSGDVLGTMDIQVVQTLKNELE